MGCTRTRYSERTIETIRTPSVHYVHRSTKGNARGIVARQQMTKNPFQHTAGAKPPQPNAAGNYRARLIKARLVESVGCGLWAAQLHHPGSARVRHNILRLRGNGSQGVNWLYAILELSS